MASLIGKVVSTLLQRRGTIAQEGCALKRKRCVQGAICAGVRYYFVRGVHWVHSFRKIEELEP
jgi:hypothetical protein